MILSILVAREKWEAFDEEWKRLMESGGPIDDLLSALRLAGEKKRIARCMGQAVEHAGLLEAADRSSCGARVLGQTLIAGGNPAELTEMLLRLSEQGWSGESWWGAYRDHAGLHEGAADLRGPWRLFSQMCALVDDTVVLHPGGWGLGAVHEVLPDSMEVGVRFHNGRRDRFPMKSAVEIFTTLPESDLRAQYFRDPEGLKKRAKDEPLEVLEAVLGRYHGRATASQIRNALMGIGIEGSAWSAWWRKVRKLAENSSWYELTGPPAKATVTRLVEAKDPSDALTRQLLHSDNLAGVHAKVRELFVGQGADPNLLGIGIQALEIASANAGEPLEERLAAWLFLRDQQGVTPPEALAALEPYVHAPVPTDPSEPPALWTLLSALPSLKDQERAVGLLPELFGENWIDVCIPHLQHAAKGMVRPLVDAYLKEGRTEEVLSTYGTLLSRPLRAPSLLVTLASRFEGGDQDLGPDLPTPVQRAQSLLSLASHLFSARRGEPHLTRVSARLNDLLCKGEDPLLRRLLAEAEPDTIRGIEAQYGRGIDSEFERITTELALSLDRQFFATQGGPFWQGQVIWTTKSGLASRMAEYKLLTDVKIPENQEAIGRAASFGDLSENSEWEAAIEEQRNLTTRAKAMEEELRHTDLIENAAIPENSVAPGTRVQYKELDSGEEREVLLLGPWDPSEWAGVPVVSYRAPLAQGMLGRHVGDTCTLQLPSGGLDVLIQAIQIEDLEG
ncbi:MAG: GreA/GreB family elongation factor [Planctomycetota bacterium]